MRPTEYVKGNTSLKKGSAARAICPKSRHRPFRIDEQGECSVPDAEAFRGPRAAICSVSPANHLRQIQLIHLFNTPENTTTLPHRHEAQHKRLSESCKKIAIFLEGEPHLGAALEPQANGAVNVLLDGLLRDRTKSMIKT